MSTLSDVDIFANAVGRVVNVSQYDLQLTERQHHHLRDALSTGQLNSKLQAVKLLIEQHYKHAVFIGHWHGMLPRLLHDYGIIDSAVGIEIDPFWSEFSGRVNWDWGFRSVVDDAQGDISRWCSNADIVINTSCEHMRWDWLDSISKSSCIFAQATDMPAGDHVTEIISIEQFCKQFETNNRKIIKYDVLALHADYSRYSVLAGHNHGRN